MIDRLQIKDFQRHEKLQIKLDSSIVAIVGPSDTGKSTIIRAIRWLALNKPRGNSFIRVGQKSASVKMRVDGKTIERARDGRENIYKVAGKELKAFGNDVPPDVSQLLRLSDVNFQMQHEPMFWFSLTAGEVAKELNGIVDLSIIDETISDLNSQRRKVSAELGVVDDRLGAASEKLESLGFVDDLTVDWELLQDLQEENDTKARKRGQIADAVELALDMQAKAGNALQAHLCVSKAVSLGKVWVDLLDRIDSLSESIQSIEENQRIVDIKPPNIGVLEQICAEVEQIEDRCQKLKSLQRIIEQAVEKVSDLASDLVVVETELQENYSQCPLCGAEMQ